MRWVKLPSFRKKKVCLLIELSQPIIVSCILMSPKTIIITSNSTNPTPTNTPTGFDSFMVVTKASMEVVKKQSFWKSSRGEFVIIEVHMYGIFRQTLGYTLI